MIRGKIKEPQVNAQKVPRGLRVGHGSTGHTWMRRTYKKAGPLLAKTKSGTRLRKQERLKNQDGQVRYENFYRRKKKQVSNQKGKKLKRKKKGTEEGKNRRYLRGGWGKKMGAGQKG